MWINNHLWVVDQCVCANPSGNHCTEPPCYSYIWHWDTFKTAQYLVGARYSRCCLLCSCLSLRSNRRTSRPRALCHFQSRSVVCPRVLFQAADLLCCTSINLHESHSSFPSSISSILCSSRILSYQASGQPSSSVLRQQLKLTGSLCTACSKAIVLRQGREKIGVEWIQGAGVGKNAKMMELVSI